MDTETIEADVITQWPASDSERLKVRILVFRNCLFL